MKVMNQVIHQKKKRKNYQMQKMIQSRKEVFTLNAVKFQAQAINQTMLNSRSKNNKIPDNKILREEDVFGLFHKK